MDGSFYKYGGMRDGGNDLGRCYFITDSRRENGLDRKDAFRTEYGLGLYKSRQDELDSIW